MNWITERLTTLMSERNLTVDTLARRLAIERSRLTNILAGTAIANENLVKRLARAFDQDAAEWLDNTHGQDGVERTPCAIAAGFLKVAKVSELSEGEMKIVCDGLAVVANADGGFHAFGNVCPHAAGPIGEGFLEGFVVECPWHAGRWDVRTGKALTLLATADIPLFELRINGDDIEIALTPAPGEPPVQSTKSRD